MDYIYGHTDISDRPITAYWYIDQALVVIDPSYGDVTCGRPCDTQFITLEEHFSCVCIVCLCYILLTHNVLCCIWSYLYCCCVVAFSDATQTELYFTIKTMSVLQVLFDMSSAHSEALCRVMSEYIWTQSRTERQKVTQS